VTAAREGGTERFLFANQLRGLAALCVVVTHLAGVYWAERQLVADATFSPIQAGAAPPFYGLLTNPWFNLGPLGVALFFLISGFVIPISLERQSPSAFLIARFFRIYPTYWLALLIEILTIAVSAVYWHRPFVLGGRLIAANALLVTDIFNVPTVDYVNWTLTVELKFYLLMALIAVPVRRGSLAVLLSVGAGIFLITRFSHEIFLALPGLGLALRIFESNALYVLFMLIGVAFSYHARGLIGSKRLGAAVLILFGLFVVCWPLTFFRAEYPFATASYGYALIAFSTMYAFRNAVRPSRILDYFAAISYPLYLVHFLAGVTLMQLMTIAWHVDAGVATLVAFAVSIGLATVLHYVIELPSQAFGKALSRRYTTAAVLSR
jgi:peptidoglycan/LPS O-acetylase OafA/YrhL